MPPAIILDNLTLGYDRHPAIHHLNTGLDSGSLTAIVGPNGAGKSTLLKGITGVLRPLEGSITLDRTPHQSIAYLPQQAEIDRSFPVTVKDLVAMGLWHEIGAFGGVGPRQEVKIGDALAAVGLTGFERRIIGTLSGGQMQRTLFARLLVQDASIILLDEPFNAIDSKTAADLIALIHRWHGERRTILAALHDIDQIRRHFPRSLVIARELVAHGDTATVLTSENLFRARQLCEAFNDGAAVCDRQVA